MTEPSCIFAFSTRKYEAMLRFFSDIGFEVSDGAGTQLCPLFNSGRGAYIRRNNIEFILEESTGDQPSAPFNLWILDYTPEEIQRAPYLGYPYTCVQGIYGLSHTLVSPDGGRIAF